MLPIILSGSPTAPVWSEWSPPLFFARFSRFPGLLDAAVGENGAVGTTDNELAAAALRFRGREARDAGVEAPPQ